jgi:DNA-binding response OmpR family regulator
MPVARMGAAPMTSGYRQPGRRAKRAKTVETGRAFSYTRAMDATRDRPMRIVIGENNADLAMTLQLLLESEPDMSILATAGSMRELRQIAVHQAPDAFILDLSLDDGPSMPLIEQLRAQLPQAAIIVFTGHSNDMLRTHCLQAGANEVLIKTGAIEELIAALRRTADPAARDRAPAPLSHS